MGSGRTLELPRGGAKVFFPAARHAHDASSGPLAVVMTPAVRFTIYIEAGDIWHLVGDTARRSCLLSRSAALFPVGDWLITAHARYAWTPQVPPCAGR